MSAKYINIWRFIGCSAVLLSSCSSMTKQEFFQDKQNMEKSVNLANKASISGCDKIIELNKFLSLQTPTNNDLAGILRILGLNEKDATDPDKIYKIDWSVINKYSCTEIRAEKEQYCLKKYGALFDLFKENQCLASLYENLPPHSTYDKYDRSMRYDYDGKDLSDKIENKVKEMYAIPEESEFLLQEFTVSELIKAKNTKLGTYDGDCSYSGPYAYMNIFTNDLCDYETKTVTRLNAARTLYRYCVNKIFLPNETDRSNCICYAYETYDKVNFKNLIYIYEKEEIPQSKKKEFEQLLTKCKKKIEKERIKKEQERYGEASK